MRWTELPDTVLAELTDEKYMGRMHHNKGTYAAGCRGPLCRRQERDTARNEREYDWSEYKPDEIDKAASVVTAALKDLPPQKRRHRARQAAAWKAKRGDSQGSASPLSGVAV